jgi:hypothetical protein
MTEMTPIAPGQAYAPGVVNPIIDQYSPLSHKQAIGDGSAAAFVAPSWVPQLERRRLAAYTILEAYYCNVARYFLPALVDTQTRREHREYGDAALLVHQALAALLGEEQTLVVDPLDETDDSDPDAATEPPEGSDGDQAEDDAEDAALLARQEWFDGWADRNRLFLKLTEAETNAVKLGDGVYVLGWDPGKADVSIRQYNPGFYFPVLAGDEDVDEFPTKVHLAWELLRDDMTRFVRRITFELTPLAATDKGAIVVERRSDGTDIYGRRYAWQDPEDEPSRVTCRVSDATWPLSAARSKAGLADLSPANGVVEVLDDGTPVWNLDLGYDFLPIVHVPNTPEGPAHFGRSVISSVAQVLDDLSSTDSDLQVGSATVASAKMKGKGGVVAGDGSPGSFYELPDQGDVAVIETSTVLDAQLKYRDSLDSRLSQNSRLAPALLGKTKGSLPSGIALQMTFGPTQSLVRELRQIRDEKYPLLLKMVQRIALVNGALDGDVYPARIALGSFLPADKQMAVDQAAALLNAKAISTVTAVGMLIEAGFPIDDAVSEVSRIHAEAFTAAAELLAATGDEGVVFDFLGLPRPVGGPPPPPVPPVPPGGGAPGSSQ